MIEAIKENISRVLISRKLKNIVLSEQDFSEALKRSGSFLILMPEDEKDFRACFVVLEHLEHINKSVKILTRDYRISLMPAKFRNKAMEFGVADLNRLDLPNHKLIEKLSEMRFDGVIDLNRKDELFYSYATNLVNARVRIGFAKLGADKYYNFQITNNDIDSEISYNNFLNCLKMF
jgi:predicted Zn-ribbon and HTH transcriptional regulator